MYHDVRGDDDEEVASDDMLIEELEIGPMLGTFQCMIHWQVYLLIANYLPLDEDLDHPARLEQSAETNSEASSSSRSSDVSRTWYPSLEKTISCLSKLYRCLEPAVFTGLALEAVEVCSLSIQKACKLIAKRSSTMDGQLFLIKFLLILREQIAPFDIEFSVTQKELDFSHMLIRPVEEHIGDIKTSKLFCKVKNIIRQKYCFCKISKIQGPW